MKRLFVPVFVIAHGLVLPQLATGKLTSKQVEFFENKIRPVLAEACYECHNSVDKAKGDIALDWRDALVASDIIVVGKPEKSTLIQAIKHADGYEPMPSKKPKLAKLIVKNFEDWIRMGAPDPRATKPTRQELANQVDWDAVREDRKKWWSYQPISDPRPPKVSDPEWTRTAIDQFIKGRLEQEGLTPQGKASPARLVRRLHQVLLGTPPPLELVHAFQGNPSQEAYEKIVDELLASDRFGERWGRYWLDWFRYAESHGSEGDPAVPYPTVYRDYVIRALNADVPYDQLVKEAVAGDLLSSPRVNEELGINESAIGPGHFRMVPHGFGVTDAYNEQISFIDNQVDVLTKAVMGSTLSCARCHNHKFDPLSQADYYKFYGIMVSSRPGVVNIDSPVLQKQNRAEMERVKHTIRRGLAEYWLAQVDEVVESISMGEHAAKKLLAEAGGREGHPFHAWAKMRPLQDGQVGKVWADLCRVYENRLMENRERIANATFYADLREQKTYDRWFKNGTGLNGTVDPAGSIAVAVEGDHALRGIYPRGVYTHMRTDKDNATLGSVFHQAKGRYSGIRAIGKNSTVRMTPRSYPLSHGGLHPTPSPKEEFSWLKLNKYFYWNDEQVFYQLTTAADQTYRTGKGRGWFGVTEVYAGEQPLSEVGNPAMALPGAPETVSSRVVMINFYRKSIADALAAWRSESLSDTQAVLLESLRKHNILSDRLADVPASIRAAVESYRKLDREIREPLRAPGVVEGEPWDQPLLVQGQYKKEADPVSRGFLEAFGGREYSKRDSGRLELAEDMLRRDNPLTARVMVNRLWHHTFGRGLVADCDNFGRLGKPPSHPDLLDYLASRFRTEDQWSVKKMIRRLVTSRTFMSGSVASGDNMEKDPANTLMAHFSPRRLDAEAIYDSMYAISGSNQQAAIYRRAKRNNLDPFLTAFNFPIPTTTTGVRDLTNVPAQSLIMLNGAEARRAAEQLARRIETDRSLIGDEQKIVRLFELAYSRRPSASELSACMAFLSAKPESGEVMKNLMERQQRLAAVTEKMEQARETLLTPVKRQLQARADARNEVARERGEKQVPDLKPMARWDFEGDTKDVVGNLHGTIRGKAKVENGVLQLNGGAVFTTPIQKPLKAMSLEALVQLDGANQRGGGVITVQDLRGDQFNSMVYAENASREWLAGSDNHRRTLPFSGGPDNEVDQRPVRMVMVFHEDGSIEGFRDGKPYGKRIRKSAAASFKAGDSQVVFGLRHGTRPSGNRVLRGKILEARLYDRVLTRAEIAAAASGEMMEIVTEVDVVKALSAEDQGRLVTIDDRLEVTRRDLSAVQSELNAKRAALGGIPGGFTRLTHVLINSKELIYVY